MHKLCKTLTLLLLSIQLTCIFVVGAQPPEQPAGEMTPPPNALQLEKGWWEYFTARDEAFDKRYQAFQAELQKVRDTVPAGSREIAQAFVRRTLSNLSSLRELRNTELEEIPPRLVKEDYTVEELLSVILEARRSARILEGLRAESTQQQQIFSTTDSLIDNLYSAYEKIDYQTVDKLLVGLEIIAERSTLALISERLRITDHDLGQRTRYNGQVKDEVAAATERLRLDSIDTDVIDQDIEKIDESLKELKRQRINAQGLVSSNGVTSDIDKSSNLLEMQKIITLLVQEANLQAERLILEAKKLLLKTDKPSEQEMEAAQKILSNWDTSYNLLSKDLIRLRSLTEQERARLRVMREAPQEGSPRVADELQKVQDDRYKELVQSFSELTKLEDQLVKAEALMDIIDDQLIQQQPIIYRPIYAFWIQFSDFTNAAVSWMQEPWFKIGEVPLSPLGILKAITIIVVAWGIGRVLTHVVDKLTKKKRTGNVSTIYTLKRIIRYLLLAGGLFIALASLGFSLQNLALILGALSVGIGFGLQNIVNNFLCGLIILFERNVKVGDFVELGEDLTGEVKEVKAQTTIVHTFRGMDVLIPNSEVVTNRLVNWTMKSPYMRLHIPFGVSYGTDMDKVREAVIEVGTRSPYTATRGEGVVDPQVWFVGFGDSSLNFELVVWVNLNVGLSRSSLRSSYLWGDPRSP